jgi:hypothetical protein
MVASSGGDRQLEYRVLREKIVRTDDEVVSHHGHDRPVLRLGHMVKAHRIPHPDAGARRARGISKTLRGYLQADAYVAYDSFFLKPERGMVEVGCWAHARRHVHPALETDPSRMRTILLLTAKRYRVEKLAWQQGLGGEDLQLMHEQGARPILEKLHAYLLESREQLLPKSEAGQAVNYILKN